MHKSRKKKAHRSPAPKKRPAAKKRSHSKKMSVSKKKRPRIIINLDGQENRKALRHIFRGTIPSHGKLILAAH